ncbi:MAG: hypothetical protein JWQ71_4090 [Pedosphaera sp.]|nr:hypothetical protein [Pedosphaera sp.]
MKYIVCLTSVLALLAFTGCQSDNYARGGSGTDTYYSHGYGYDRDHGYNREPAPNSLGNARMRELQHEDWNQDHYRYDHRDQW